MSNGHRWSKFWWQDWQNDKALNRCSLAARGLWMEMLCIAHEGEPYGHLKMNGQALTVSDIADMVAKTTEKEVTKLLAELEAKGVFSRTEGGIIYSRRMEKDGQQSEAGREFVARRWNGKSPHPPNRGAIRSPTSKPNGSATSHPHSPPITKTSESEAKNLSKNLGEVRAGAREGQPDSRVAATVAELAKALKTKPPPFTPSVVYQRSALEPAPRRPQPQEPIMTVEEQMVELHRMMAEEAVAKGAHS